MLGLGTVAKKVFGTTNDRMVKSVRPLVDKINSPFIFPPLASEKCLRTLVGIGVRES